MNPSANRPTTSGLVLAASILICFGVWQWADHLLVPVNTARAIARRQPIGNNSDFYPVWLTAREVLLQGQPPYSARLTTEIQEGFYGRKLDPMNPADPKDIQAFVYPLYVVFLIAPAVTLPFGVVVEVFRCLFLLCIASSVPLWMCAIGFRPKRFYTASGIILALSNFPAVLEYRQLNLTALVVVLLAGSFAAATCHWLPLSGLLLALSTFKPQLSGFLIVWMLLWAASRWKERAPLVWGFIATLFSLVGAATAISPHWMTGFWEAARMYRSYGLGPSVFQVMLPRSLAICLIAGLVVFTAFTCWKCRRAQAASTQFAGTVALLAALTVTLASQAAHYQLLLLPALLFLVASVNSIRAGGFLIRTFAKGVFFCLLWQWCTALGLALCSMWHPAPKLQLLAELPMYTMFALPVLTLLVVVGAILAVLPPPQVSGLSDPRRAGV